MIISLLFAHTISGTSEICPALPNGLVINKYYLEDCGACKRLSPVMDEIRSKLEKSDLGIKYREIECNECDCSGIDVFPTVQVTQDKVVTGKTTGYKDYDALSLWLTDKLSIDGEIFKHERSFVDGTVNKLLGKDFLSGFDGQWLILFYENKNDAYRKLVSKIAKDFKGRIHVGEVHKSDASAVETRFGLQNYPTIFALNHGTAVPYTGEANESSLNQFSTKLAEPNFKSIDYTELQKQARTLRSGEPLYVVLYKNYEVASHYFNDMSQQFKFRVQIFKSSDPQMFAAVGFEPKEMTESGDYNEMTRLVLFKNGTFYPCLVPLDKPDSIIQWIFHTHFMHVTEINNETFYSVFHGMKPVFILISPNEVFLDQFNQVSAERHLGTPYLTIVFAYLNSGEYADFMRLAMPKVKTPALAFYDPTRNKWFVEKSKLTKDNFKNKTIETIENYFSNKLAEYPPKKNYWKYYLIGIAWIVLVAGYLAFTRYSEKSKLNS